MTTAELWGSQDMANRVVVDPGASWSAVSSPKATAIPLRPNPAAVDAAGPDATLGRAHDARPQVLGNRSAIPTASTALRRLSPKRKQHGPTLATAKTVDHTGAPQSGVAAFEVFPGGRISVFGDTMSLGGSTHME